MSRSNTGPDRPRSLFGVPREVVLLGIVSLLTDVSSEAVFAVLPLFMTSVLGASTSLLGAMEGLADFAGSSLDMVSGYVSDRTGKRKPFAVFGYGLSSAAKAVLPLASTIGHVFAFRVVERLGKSIRGVPRDALLSVLASKERRGTAFGLHKALDKAGAVLGPLLAYALLDRFGQSAAAFHKLFIVALVPAWASVALLALLIREKTGGREGTRLRIRDALRNLGPRYRHYLIAAGLFSWGYFSVAFLLLAAARVGFAAKHVALLYALFNGSFTVVSIPLGRLGDRIGRRALILSSYALYAIMAVGFAAAASKPSIVVLFIVYGAFYAIDEGQTKAYISDLVPEQARATAIGIYGFVTALVYLPASVIAGLLWKAFGPPVAFAAAASMAVIASVFFVGFGPRGQKSHRTVIEPPPPAAGA